MSILQAQDELFRGIEETPSSVSDMLKTLEKQSNRIIENYGYNTIASDYALDVLKLINDIKKLH